MGSATLDSSEILPPFSEAHRYPDPNLKYSNRGIKISGIKCSLYLKFHLYTIDQIRTFSILIDNFKLKTMTHVSTATVFVKLQNDC